MALRDGSMWSSTPTVSEDRGASRLAAVVSGHYGRVREGTGLGPVPFGYVDYSAMSR